MLHLLSSFPLYRPPSEINNKPVTTGAGMMGWSLVALHVGGHLHLSTPNTVIAEIYGDVDCFHSTIGLIKCIGTFSQFHF